MYKIEATCQYQENYGFETGTEHWKNKGGATFMIKIPVDSFDEFMYLSGDQRIAFCQFFVDKYVNNVNGEPNTLSKYTVVECDPVYNEPGQIDPNPDEIDKALAEAEKTRDESRFIERYV